MPCSSTLHHPAPTGNRRLGTPSERARPRARAGLPLSLVQIGARRHGTRPGPARAVPSYIHIHFRPGPAGARPAPARAVRAFIHTYTLQVRSEPDVLPVNFSRPGLKPDIGIHGTSMGQVNRVGPTRALVQPSPALTRTQGVAVGAWTWWTRLTRKASELSVALRFCCGA